MWPQTIGLSKPLFSHRAWGHWGQDYFSHTGAWHVGGTNQCWMKGKYFKIHIKKLFLLKKRKSWYTMPLPTKFDFYLYFLMITIRCLWGSTQSGIKSWPHPWAIMWPWERYLASVKSVKWRFLRILFPRVKWVPHLERGRAHSVCQMLTIVIIFIKSRPWYFTLWLSSLYEKIVLYALLLAKVGKPGNSCRGREKQARKASCWIPAPQRWEGGVRYLIYWWGSGGVTCPRVSFKTQPQLFIESRTRAPGVAMVKL